MELQMGELLCKSWLASRPSTTSCQEDFRQKGALPHWCRYSSDLNGFKFVSSIWQDVKISELQAGRIPVRLWLRCFEQPELLSWPYFANHLDIEHPRLAETYLVNYVTVIVSRPLFLDKVATITLIWPSIPWIAMWAITLALWTKRSRSWPLKPRTMKAAERNRCAGGLYNRNLVRAHNQAGLSPAASSWKRWSVWQAGDRQSLISISANLIRLLEMLFWPGKMQLLLWRGSPVGAATNPTFASLMR